MTKRFVPGDVDLRGFSWRLAALQPPCEIAAQRAEVELADREREHAALRSELESTRDAYREQLSVLGRAGSLDPSRQRRALLYLVQVLERLHEQQGAVDACAASVEEGRRARVAAQQRLDSLLRLHDDAAALYATQERHRDGKQADQAWLAGFARARSRRAGEGQA